MKYPFLQTHSVKIVAMAALCLTACVDNDYDLAKDIDMNVQVGGDLTFPTSNTDNYTMVQVMNLSDNSSIVPDGQKYGLNEGDYVLVQDGDATSSSVNIPKQVVYDTECSSTTNQISVVNSDQTMNLPNLVNEIHLLDNNIDKAVRSISFACTDIALDFKIQITSATLSSGAVTLKPGFSITFPNGWTVEPGNAAAAAYTRANGNKIVFTADRQVSVGSTMVLSIKITGINLKGLATGQGLYEPGKFRLDDRIVTSGPVVFRTSAVPAGQVEQLKIALTPQVSVANILKVTGSVDPVVNVSESSFNIHNIPDFLFDTSNNLDVVNPQIVLTVKNTSPVDFTVSGCLTAYDDKNVAHKVYVGQPYGTDAITVRGNGESVICLSRTGSGYSGGATAVEQVKVPNLASLIESVPKRIVLGDIDVKASTKEYTFDLGQDYYFNVDYRAIVPLAFGKDLRFTYSTQDTGWGEDLDKYSFKEVVVSLEIENTAPLDMVPAVLALDKEGKVIDDVTAEVTGVVKAGETDKATTSQLTVTLRSNAKNIGNLDGIRFTFTATCPEQYAGIALNEAQRVRFTDIKVKLKGGIGVDLN